MSVQSSFAIVAFSAIFVIVDPIGVAPLFIALTPGDSTEKRRQMARRACIVAWCVLTAFALAGVQLLSVFGITLEAFKVAGGLLMLITALDQLRAKPPRTRTTHEEQEAGAAKDDISIVPLAIPLLAGPGAIATVMVIMSRAENLWQHAVVIIAMSVTMLSAYAVMHWSEQVARLLGTTGRLVIERIIGFVLAAIGVQFILDGAVQLSRRS